MSELRIYMLRNTFGAEDVVVTDDKNAVLDSRTLESIDATYLASNPGYSSERLRPRSVVSYAMVREMLIPSGAPSTVQRVEICDRERYDEIMTPYFAAMEASSVRRFDNGLTLHSRQNPPSLELMMMQERRRNLNHTYA